MDFHCIDMLLALPEFRVIPQVMRAQQLDVHLERRATSIVCPRCQRCCSRVKESRPRCLRAFPILERPVVRWLQLRRVACSACSARPWEQSETFGEPVKWTPRLYNQVRQEYVSGCPCDELARRSGLSPRTVCRWTCERRRGGRLRRLGRALGIDAYARRKGPRYNPLIMDLERGKPMATFTGRRAEDVIAWFHRYPPDALKRVAVVVVDMSKPYLAAMQAVLGDGVPVINRFQVVKQAVDALEAVWRSVPKQLEKDEAKALKKLRKRWLKSADQLHVDELSARYEWRRRFPELRETIDWGQDLRKWCERK